MGPTLIAGPGKRSTDAREPNLARPKPDLRMEYGNGGKTSLAVCNALSAQCLRLALAAGDCAGAGSAGGDQEGLA
jgi:hypothetical protein